MSFDQDPNEQANISGADLAIMCDEITALKIEISRLESCLQWEQNRAARVGTHGPDCHLWGPAHYECLLRKFAAIVTSPPPQYQD